MMITTKELVDALTKTLKNINQSPTIPLPVFKGKKGEDSEDHILKVEDYFEIHQITQQTDKIRRFKDTLFETARKWAQTLNYTELIKFDYNSIILKTIMTRKPQCNIVSCKICKRKQNSRSSLQCLEHTNF